MPTPSTRHGHTPSLTPDTVVIERQERGIEQVAAILSESLQYGAAVASVALSGCVAYLLWANWPQPPGVVMGAAVFVAFLAGWAWHTHIRVATEIRERRGDLARLEVTAAQLKLRVEDLTVALQATLADAARAQKDADHYRTMAQLARGGRYVDRDADPPPAVALRSPGQAAAARAAARPAPSVSFNDIEDSEPEDDDPPIGGGKTWVTPTPQPLEGARVQAAGMIRPAAAPEPLPPQPVAEDIERYEIEAGIRNILLRATTIATLPDGTSPYAKRVMVEAGMIRDAVWREAMRAIAAAGLAVKKGSAANAPYIITRIANVEAAVAQARPYIVTARDRAKK